MGSMRLGELCAGYGGLGMAVEEVFGATTAWFSEYDSAPSKILAHHWPDVPNHGDMTKIDWAAIEPVDIISGGTPCQDLSNAGKRAGMSEGTRSNLWVNMREGIAIQRPKYVVWENVRGAYSAGADSEMEQSEGRVGADGNPHLRALGRVLGDLSDLGYDTQWRGLRAADVGACHGRFRVFVLAANSDYIREHRTRKRTKQDRRGQLKDSSVTVSKPQGVGGGEGRAKYAGVKRRSDAVERGTPTNWGNYEPAIRSWESVMGRCAPAPTETTGRAGGHRLSPRFTEWMMGLPDGWVTDPAIGISRNEQLKACGNGVVPQQAVAALRLMLDAFDSSPMPTDLLRTTARKG
jgi:DNA (cytosine-5)-methyltransferase 1